jgi:hypothetical protein
MATPKKEKQKTASGSTAARGKKAIEAGKKAMGENPSDPATKKKEKKDAATWRNEG